MDLAGNPLRAGTTSCDGLGLVLVAVLWTRASCLGSSKDDLVIDSGF